MRRIFPLLLILSLPSPARIHWRQSAPIAIHIQGKLALRDLYPTDLDGGPGKWMVTVCADCDVQPTWPTSFRESDFMFQIVGKRRYFHPQHGAMFSKGVVTPAGYAGCSEASYVKGKLRLDNFPADATICMRTNEKRYAEIHIDAFDAKKKSSPSRTSRGRKNPNLYLTAQPK